MRRPVAVVFALALVAAATPLISASAAPRHFGSISGRVTDSQTGRPIPNVCVIATDESGDTADPFSVSADTDADGNYSVDGLPAGDNFSVYFEDCNSHTYVDESYPTPVLMPDEGNVDGIDQQLAPGAQISGTVTDGKGTEVDGVCVVAHWSVNGADRLDVAQSENGEYQIGQLPAATYRVEFDPSCAQAGVYAHQWYDGVGAEQDATPLDLGVGEAVDGIDASLKPANPPTVTSVSPTTGALSGGTFVTVTGQNVVGVNSITFGGVPAPWLHVVNADTVVTVAPSMSAGVVDVVLSNSAASSAPSSADEFTYDPSEPTPIPSVTTIRPAGGPTSGGGWVDVRGNNLASASDVSFGDTAAQQFFVFNNNELEALAPPHGGGVVNVSVHSPLIGDTLASQGSLYSYGPPVITSITPRTGPMDGGTIVTITGHGLSTARVMFGSVPVRYFVKSDDFAEVTAPPATSPGPVDVTAISPGGASVATPADVFTYQATFAAATTIQSPMSASEQVVLSSPATFTLTNAATQPDAGAQTSPDIAITGNGRLTGFMVSQQGQGASGPVLLAVNDNHCETSGCTSVSPTLHTELSNLTPAHNGGSSTTYTLPAGTYNVQTIADGGPVSITLTLHGLTGSTALAPTGPTDLNLTSADASVPSGPVAAPVYSGGATGTLSGVGGVAFTDLDVTTSTAVSMHDGICSYSGTPPNAAGYAPGCPGQGTPGGGQSNAVGPFTTPTTFAISGAQLAPAGSASIGAWAATTGAVTDAHATDLFLSFDPPADTGTEPELPETPFAVLLPLLGLVAGGLLLVVRRRRG